MAARPSDSHPIQRRRWPTFKCAFAPSHSVRLAQIYQVARPRTAMELYRRSCQRVAQGNELLRSYGLLALVIENMAPIEASLASESVPDLYQALHEAELGDCLEQPADEAFREKLRQGKATVDEAREYIRKSAMARHKAEQAERAVAQWIKEQEGH